MHVHHFTRYFFLAAVRAYTANLQYHSAVFQCVFDVWCEKTVEHVGCVAAQEPSYLNALFNSPRLYSIYKFSIAFSIGKS